MEGCVADQLNAGETFDGEIFGANSDYVETLYDAYLKNPAAVPAWWAERFSALSTQGESARPTHLEMLERNRLEVAPPFGEIARPQFEVEYPSRALYLINAYRMHGHLHANLDPLRLEPPNPSPDLELAFYGLSEADLERTFAKGDLPGSGPMTLRQIVALMRQCYCGNIGPEFMHISDSAKRLWLQRRIESCRSTPAYDAASRRHIYEQVMRAEELERFLHTRFAGQKRFSLEGGESLIAMLDRMVGLSGSRGVREIIMGMAHRGRINVLANIMGKSLSDIFAEFEGSKFASAEHGAGDVKYHMGFSSDINTAGGNVHLALAFNPSHLEIITPVVMGSVRARQCRRGDKERRQVQSVLIHGDAAFAGQGVVAESLNLSELRGFRIGGTVHLVVNNQIGFTVNPFDARSTLYATDLAKMVQAPILHVNGDDPEACVLAMEIALEYRHTFRSDVVVDLVCYRRHGHNEVDTPEVTQPVMYRAIKAHPTTAALYRQRLEREGVLTAGEAETMAASFRDLLERVRRENHQAPAEHNSLRGRWNEYMSSGAPEPETAVPGEQLRDLVRRVHTLPAEFDLHPLVQKIYGNRIAMIDGQLPIDWGCAETMAYATLIHEGGWVRVSGQDSGRGTFFHRHAVVYDSRSGRSFMPLRQIRNGPMSHVIVVDSMLSEMAVMAYEYGYSVAEPRALVVWEAQFGDFANNAQVVIDQFIAAGESKWGRMSGLTLWLPHGSEGQGAEHSSARLERYLQLCAEENMQVVVPTTPAQLFHLLRRQSLIRMRKPLILLAPKSMLRHPLSLSSVADLCEGGFQPILADSDAPAPERVRKVLLCSGKVYFDLLAVRRERAIDHVAIIRIERLYPFPETELRAELARYAQTASVVWVQEEPENQGAWYPSRHHMQNCLSPGQQLAHLARPALAAPAVGSAKRHAEQQQTLIEAALA